jgi:tetratricopeptide (TPR) repeat protein
MSLDEALILYDQRQYAKAARELRLALALAPQDGFAHAMLALCLCAERNWPSAREHALQAIELAPSLGICFYAWARVQAAQIRCLDVPLIGRRWSNPTQVAQVYGAIQKAIELNPGNPDFFALKAEFELQLQRWHKGLEASERGLVLDPQHAECAHHRAAALLFLGRRTEAVENLQRALALIPELDDCVWVRGWRALAAGRANEALRTFLDGLRHEPRSEWLQLGLVEALKMNRSIFTGLVGWRLRALIWRGRPTWRRTLAISCSVIYLLCFVGMSHVLRGQFGFEPIAIRAILAFSAACAVSVAVVLFIPLADFVIQECLRWRVNLWLAQSGPPSTR